MTIDPHDMLNCDKMIMGLKTRSYSCLGGLCQNTWYWERLQFFIAAFATVRLLNVSRIRRMYLVTKASGICPGLHYWKVSVGNRCKSEKVLVLISPLPECFIGCYSIYSMASFWTRLFKGNAVRQIRWLYLYIFIQLMIQVSLHVPLFWGFCCHVGHTDCHKKKSI